MLMQIWAAKAGEHALSASLSASSKGLSEPCDNCLSLRAKRFLLDAEKPDSGPQALLRSALHYVTDFSL